MYVYCGVERMKSTYNNIYNEICKLPVIDTHEHIAWLEKYRKGDVLNEYLSSYLSSDIISAGLKRSEFNKVMNTEINIMERWSIVETFWEVARYTGYGRSLDIAVQGIYGIDGINRNTIEKLSEIYKENYREGHYEYVLRDLCNIETSLVTVWPYPLEGENSILKRVWDLRDFIMPNEYIGADPIAYRGGADIISYFEKKFGLNVNTLDDWLNLMEKELDYVICSYGTRVIKVGLAYERTLRFEKVDYSLAKMLFSKALGIGKRVATRGERQLIFAPELQDFMMHYLLKLANERNLTVQIHTGLLEGNGNVLTNSDPSLLINLFLEYPDVDFDIFHISYPYQTVACALAKMFPNVYIDMCWAHIISPSACISALDDFLDAIPYNKISAFGGDYGFVDGIYGHLMISRQNVAHTLTAKVQRGVFDEGKAIDIAKALYYDNPKRIFKL